MKITLVPSATDGSTRETIQYASSTIINDHLAIDAGTLGNYRTPNEQQQIRHLVLSHTHIDHIASLPVFLENIYNNSADCLTVYGSRTTLDCLQKDLFNNRIWPDFIDLSRGENKFLRLQPLEANQTLSVGGLTLRAVALHHVVPTLGFIVSDSTATVAFVSDTGPTDEIWKQLNQLAHLDALFVECCFPNVLDWLARASLHLTPRQLALELAKLRHQPRIYAIHLKPRYREELVREIADLRWPHLEVGVFGVPYQIG